MSNIGRVWVFDQSKKVPSLCITNYSAVACAALGCVRLSEKQSPTASSHDKLARASRRGELAIREKITHTPMILRWPREHVYSRTMIYSLEIFLRNRDECAAREILCHDDLTRGPSRWFYFLPPAHCRVLFGRNSIGSNAAARHDFHWIVRCFVLFFFFVPHVVDRPSILAHAERESRACDECQKHMREINAHYSQSTDAQWMRSPSERSHFFSPLSSLYCEPTWTYTLSESGERAWPVSTRRRRE